MAGCRGAPCRDGTLGVSVKVTSVEGEQINFDIKADDTASPAPN
ncbi:hypothetical protein [Streptomyces rubiginosohelvolus]